MPDYFGITPHTWHAATWYQSSQCIIGMEFVDSLRYNKCTSGKVYKSYDIKARTAFDIGQPCNRTGFVILNSTSMTIWHNEAGTKCPPSCIHHLQIMGCLSWVSWKIKSDVITRPDCNDNIHDTKFVLLTPVWRSVRVWLRMMLKTAWERLLSLFMLVAATVRDLLPSDMRESMSCNSRNNGKW